MIQNLIELYNSMNHFGRFMQMEYSILNVGEVEYKLTVREELLATQHAAHGGALAAFMDAILGVTSLSAVADEGKLVATIEFKINYLKPALIGDNLTGKGKVIQKGKRILITEGEIYNQKNELIVKAIGTFTSYQANK
jgi:acyl-CoA thioesterase